MADQRDKLEEEKLAVQFIQYISLLANTAMQHLGKIMNPQTGKIERNLEAASAVIDLISMIKAKTKGNLSRHEDQIISNAISNLQLDYADELVREKE